MALVDAAGLHVSLNGTAILAALDFDLEKGQWHGLLGPNGSGKTTLLRTIAGLLPYKGTLHLEGKEVSVWSRRAMARRVAFVRQTHAVSFDFKVIDLVLLGRAPHKALFSVYNHADQEQASTALNQLDLGGFENRSFHSLSGGEQQRVFLAQALVQEADLLILDEPTTYLDVHHQFEFMEHVRSLVHAGKTVFGAMHDLEMAARFADHLMVLHKGRLVCDGTPKEILTPELLATVFRMEAAVDEAGERSLHISYARSLP